MKKIIILIGFILLLGIVLVFLQTQGENVKDAAIKAPRSANDILEQALSTNMELKSYRVTLERIHQKIGTVGSQILDVEKEVYQFRVIRRSNKANIIAQESEQTDISNIPNTTQKQPILFSIDVDSILKSRDNYLVRIQDIQKSDQRIFYLVEMRHKTAKLANGQQPVIQLRIAEDNWMVYTYHLMAADSTELAHAEFEYDMIQGFWLPIKIVTRFTHTGDIFTDTMNYSQFQIKNDDSE